MNKWDPDYMDKVSELEFFFQRLYPSWTNIDIDCDKERPESFDRLHETVNELFDALVDFTNDIEYINEEE